eukprot:CAMPEP_0172687424 /NCGR_PEP_ID=MMETSP1074-20121228/21671_1 /TAXON_ID=2916 /ORGANISM="Ceratium fusus, Strain PA161109" /LENGTH=140 /DNA_ID=CAMNT_0013506875 /DNA_START=105 /DNA_END=527 /DNA_ORIENTATION=+
MTAVAARCLLLGCWAQDRLDDSVLAFTHWRSPRAQPPSTARLSSGDSGGKGEEYLEEELRSGKTLEAELAEVIEARRQGKDVRREPGIEARNDAEIAIRKAWDQFSSFLNRVDLTNGPTLFWAVLIGLVVLSWLVQLVRF